MLQKDADGKETNAPLRRAYPIKSLEVAGCVVDDIMGSKPVAVFMNPVTIAASAVSRQVDGRTLTFEARRRDGRPISFYDMETGTRWGIEGKGVEGPLAGKMLERLDNHLSQWYGWYAYFPETTIYRRSDLPQLGDAFAAQEESKPSANDEKRQ